MRHEIASIRSEPEPLQIAPHGATGAAEVIGEAFNAGAITDVSRLIERLKIGETERASSLLAGLGEPGTDRHAGGHPRVGRDQATHDGRASRRQRRCLERMPGPQSRYGTFRGSGGASRAAVAWVLGRGGFRHPHG